MKSLLRTPRYHVQHKRNGVILKEGVYKNTLTNEGMDAICRRGFDQATALNWYMGLIDPPITSAVSDTAASHPGWVENIQYTGTNRLTWVADTYDIAPVFGEDIEVSNSVKLIFEIASGCEVRGLFLISNSTKEGTAGKLLSIVDFGITYDVTLGDEISVTFIFGFDF